MYECTSFTEHFPRAVCHPYAHGTFTCGSFSANMHMCAAIAVLFASGDTIRQPLAMDFLSIENFKVFVISLSSPATRIRRAALQALLEAIGTGHITTRWAVDGAQLQRDGGRARPLGDKGTVRVTIEVNGERSTYTHRGGRLVASGAVDLWSQVGCAWSHKLVLEHAQRHCLSACMVCEDDLCLGPSFGSTSAVRAALDRILGRLGVDFPSGSFCF